MKICAAWRPRHVTQIFTGRNLCRVAGGGPVLQFSKCTQHIVMSWFNFRKVPSTNPSTKLHKFSRVKICVCRLPSGRARPTQIFTGQNLCLPAPLREGPADANFHWSKFVSLCSPKQPKELRQPRQPSALPGNPGSLGSLESLGSSGSPGA